MRALHSASAERRRKFVKVAENLTKRKMLWSWVLKLTKEEQKWDVEITRQLNNLPPLPSRYPAQQIAINQLKAQYNILNPNPNAQVQDVNDLAFLREMRQYTPHILHL